MNRLYKVVTTLALSALFPTLSLSQEVKKPNILLVVLDDLGYADIGAYGSEIKTPNIDALAANGLSYSNFHSTPTCSPTRAALLTARESHRVGMGLVTEYDLGIEMPAFRARINPKAGTIAQVLQKDNYATYAIGKWHLTPPSQQSAAGPYDHWPSGKGFDKFYGFQAGSTDNFTPALTQDNTLIDVKYKKDEVLTTDLVDHTIRYLKDHKSNTPKKPFFVYFGLPGMHNPHQASEAYLDKYKGKYKAGWDVIRKERFEKQKELGLIPKDAKLSPANRGIEQWDTLDTKQKKVYERFQEVYAGFLEETDHEIGRLLEEIKKLGELDNTIVVVVSDNGASSSGGFHGSANRSAWNNGVKETVDDNLAVIDEMGGAKFGTNYPRGWTQTSNTPFPLYKMYTYGGGINVPCIISWPKGIAAKGEVRHQYHHVTDIMPTLLEMLGQKMPKVLDEIEQLPVDGVSMTYSFDDANTTSKRTTQYYRNADNRGIYKDGFYAAASHKMGTKLSNDKWSLYDLNKDFTQSDDLSAKEPEKLKELQAFWESEAKRIGGDAMIETFVRKQKRDNATNTSKSAPPSVNDIMNNAKSEYTFYSGSSHLPEKSTPKVMDKSFTITVPVRNITVKTEGVLVAHGNAESGYVMYMKEGKLFLEYNFVANIKSVGKMYTLASKQLVPEGNVTLSFRFTRTERGAGKGELLINDKVVASQDMPKTLASRISHEGLDVGQDRYSAVGNGYEAPFPFTADITHVHYHISKN